MLGEKIHISLPTDRIVVCYSTLLLLLDMKVSRRSQESGLRDGRVHACGEVLAQRESCSVPRDSVLASLSRFDEAGL